MMIQYILFNKDKKYSVLPMYNLLQTIIIKYLIILSLSCLLIQKFKSTYSNEIIIVYLYIACIPMLYVWEFKQSVFNFLDFNGIRCFYKYTNINRVQFKITIRYLCIIFDIIIG